MWLCLHTSLRAQPLPAGSPGGLHSHRPPIDLGVPQEWSDVSPTVIVGHDEQRAALLLLEALSPFSFTPHAFLFLHPTHICKLYCFVVFFQESNTFCFLKENASIEMNPLRVQPPAQLDETLCLANTADLRFTHLQITVKY